MTEQVLKTRANERTGAEVTMTHEVNAEDLVTAGDGSVIEEMRYTVTVEYKPGDKVLDEDALAKYIRNNLGVNIDPEVFIVELYSRIVEEAYPGHTSYDEPWKYVPLVVSVEWGPWSVDDFNSVHVGQYH